MSPASKINGRRWSNQHYDPACKLGAVCMPSFMDMELAGGILNSSEPDPLIMST